MFTHRHLFSGGNSIQKARLSSEGSWPARPRARAFFEDRSGSGWPEHRSPGVPASWLLLVPTCLLTHPLWLTCSLSLAVSF